MTLAEALAAAAARGIARLDAQLLLLQALGRAPSDRAWLLAHDTDALRPEDGATFAALVARRADGEPLAYISGRKEFHGIALEVDGRVLVPRPDTETLVDWALALMRDKPAPRVIDLGTGSGAIALALAKERPDARIEAVDASAGALEVAAANARRLGLPVTFRQAGWLEGAGTYDFILSNPPYIARTDPHLPDLRHEPAAALVSGPDGLDDLRKIVAQAPGHLDRGGWLIVEHGWDQAPAVRGLLAAAGFREVQSHRDLAGIERCSGGLRLEKG